jgi:O-antigen ligase
LELICLIIFALNANFVISNPRTRNVFILFFSFGSCIIISNLFGYAFLNIIPVYNDFMDLFKVCIYIAAYAIGYKTIFDKKIEKCWKTASLILLILLLCLAILQINKSPLAAYLLKGNYLSEEFYEKAITNRRVVRPGTTFGNTNSFTIAILPIFAMALNYFLFYRKDVIVFLSISLSAFLVILTMSRTGFFCISTIIIVSIWYLGFTKKITLISTLIILSFITLSLSQYISPEEDLSKRLRESFQTEEDENKMSGIDIRLSRMKAGVYKYKISPIFGWGVNKSKRADVVYEEIPYDVGNYRGPVYQRVETFGNPHNQYLEMLMQLGLPGLLIYLSFLIIMIKPAFAGRVVTKKSTWIRISIIAIVISLSVNALAVGFIFSNTVFLPVIFLLGILHRRIDNIA